MKSLTPLVAALAICLAAPACSSLGSSAANGPLPPARAGTFVKVLNHNWSDMVVYAVRSGTRHRLGVVTTNQSRRFRLPPGMETPGSDLRLVADPVGGRERFDSGTIHVSPGQTIQLSLENQLGISSVSISYR